jgi:Flp pilus assembly pilin Flp
LQKLWNDQRGGVIVEYILLLSIVGIGAVVGLAVLRHSLITELQQLAEAIAQIIISP